jgi:hypothetical protein
VNRLRLGQGPRFKIAGRPPLLVRRSKDSSEPLADPDREPSRRPASPGSFRAARYRARVMASRWWTAPRVVADRDARSREFGMRSQSINLRAFRRRLVTGESTRRRPRRDSVGFGSKAASCACQRARPRGLQSRCRRRSPDGEGCRSRGTSGCGSSSGARPAGTGASRWRARRSARRPAMIARFDHAHPTKKRSSAGASTAGSTIWG